MGRYWAITKRLRPAMVISNNGAKLTSMVILRWPKECEVESQYIAPGKLPKDGFVKSFNARFRDACLNETIFTSLLQARPMFAA